MGDSIRIDTDQVLEIATDIENINKNLARELDECRATINNLSTIWESEAATATIDAFNSFANKYFSEYDSILAQYVTFLRDNVSSGYVATENRNIDLAEAFR